MILHVGFGLHKMEVKVALNAKETTFHNLPTVKQI